LATLQAQNLSIGYLDRKGTSLAVCENLNLQLQSGSLTMLAGRNGSGKSSLLRSLAGLQSTLAGTIHINNVGIAGAEPQVVAALVSIMFSTPPNLGISTVGDVVLTSMQRNFTPFKTDFSREWEQVTKSLEMCGVPEFIDRRFESLSDGEKQKVMLARSLAQDTPVLLLDEPLAFLDYPSRREMLALLRKLAAEQQKTILYSSHDLDISLGYCDNLLLLRGAGKWKFYDQQEAISSLKPEALFMEI
jgi:iron complex transport system ATP-binding protein